MRKGMLRGVAGAMLVLLMYNLAVFLLPLTRTRLFWVAYGFTLVAFAVSGATVFYAFKDESAKMKFYGFPVARVGVIYFAVQLVLGIALMVISTLFPGFYWWVGLLLCAAVLVAAVLGLIVVESTKEEVVRQDAQLKRDVITMRALGSKVDALAKQSGDPALKKLAEEFRYSDPVSGPNLMQVEMNLREMVIQLQQAVMERDANAVSQLSEQTLCLLHERNHLCKVNKTR